MATNTSSGLPKPSFWGAFLVGTGVMAGVDEIIFHQLLRWHHFYDRSTLAAGIVADGLLHAAELIAIVAGIFILLDLRRQKAFFPMWAWSGFFIGMGVFQLVDGTLIHKVLSIHQIRYNVNILPYDLLWNFSALVLILVGFWIMFKIKASESEPDAMEDKKGG